MNEYNERTLKNVLQDIREEQDIDLLKEIEEAANNPLYQNKEGEAERFAEKNSKSKKKNPVKIFYRVAAIFLVFAIGSAIIPITVEGRKNTIAQIIINYVNSEFFAINNEDPFASFEGKYVPSWIPDGYEVDSITNTTDKKEIILKNSDGSRIIYNELSFDSKLNIDSTKSENTTNITINNLNAVYIEEDGIRKLIITSSDAYLYIISNDNEINLIGFAELIEKR